MNPNKKCLFYCFITSQLVDVDVVKVVVLLISPTNISLTNQFIFRYIIIKLTVFSIIHQPSYEYNFNNELF